MTAKEDIHTKCPVPNGKLMVIGGAEQKQDLDQLSKDSKLEILSEFLRLIKKDNPVIGVVTTASSDDVNSSFNAYKVSFEKIQPCATFHIHHERMAEVDTESTKEQINKADALFFTGGDQLKLTSVYGGSMFLYHAKNRYIYDQLVIAGTSAGAMALSTPMIFAGTGDNEMIAGEVKITTGFEFLKDVCIDTHFVHRGRFVRMAQVIATNPVCLGIGIEEDTAVIIKNGVEGKVFGHGVVILMDGKAHTENNITKFDSAKALEIRGLKVDILSAGCQFKLQHLNPPHY